MNSRIAIRTATVLFALSFAFMNGQSAAETVYLQQGWTAEERQTFYSMPQGSELFPYAWFLALEQPYSQGLFKESSFLEAFRYIANESSNYNPDGLPVGFVKGIAKDSKKEWLGLTCAACHTGELEYAGKRIRIDGGTTLADTIALHQALVDAVRRTLREKSRFSRFATRVLGGHADESRIEELKRDLKVHYQRLGDWAATSRPAHPTGFGNWDALTILKNSITAAAVDLPQNFRVPHIPVSYPSIWNTSKMDRVLWNGAVHNMTLRRIGEVIIVFGRANVAVTKKGYSFSSSADLQMLTDMYAYTDQLQPPQWPETILGKIDRAKAERGAKIYQRENCAQCHPLKPYPLTEPNKFDRQFIRTTRTPLAEVGTDPHYAQYFVTRTAHVGKHLQPIFDGTPFEGKTEIPGAMLFLALLQGITEAGIQAAEPQSDDERAALYGYRELPSFPKTEEEVGQLVQSLLVYKTGPLSGIWSTAPYLHNASVPNLYQLLLPPEKRMKKFHLGSRQFDPVNVGYQTDPSESGLETYEFDTSKLSMSNRGHAYGTQITESERMDLLEFLKTL